MPRGQYIAAQAYQDDSNWAMQGSRVEGADGYYLYDKKGEIVGTLPFESGKAMQAFENAMSAAILAYNGESTFFEPDFKLELPKEFDIIP